MKLHRILLSVILIGLPSGITSAQQAAVHGGGAVTLLSPPATEVKPATETINGTTVVDPYRWLEDGHSQETRAWIAAQMDYTKQYLSQVKLRPQIEKRLTELERLDTYSIPIERTGKFFFTKRPANENQASIYVRSGLQGSDERLVDPTQMSKDQNTSVGIEDISADGGLLAYGVNEGGEDESTVYFLDVDLKKAIPDILPKARYQIGIAPDRRGLYYVKIEATGSNVYYHRFASPVASDELIFGKKFKEETFGSLDLMRAEITENKRYLLITVVHGVPPTRMAIYAKDLRFSGSPIREVIHGIDNRFLAENYKDDLYVTTDYQADNYRVIRVNIKNASRENWKTVIPEGPDAIQDARIVGGKVFVTTLHDVIPRTRFYSLEGKLLGEVHYPSLGNVFGMFGQQSSRHGFYQFESFHIPPAIYHYNVETGDTQVFAKPKVPFSSEDYEVKQVFVTSRDGTKVPMFITAKKGLRQDGTAPLLMWAYGGFNVSMTPEWNPEFAWWMEQGGYYAQPNLRGGGEYGEAWHKGGMFEKKQNVFDDFYAAAEYLISQKYTRSSLLAIRGRSNGGLLMGAAMTQRPDLFGAIWCGYPLLDMLRYHKLLVGAWWTTEYGSAEIPAQFQYLIKYSPYQNTKPGTNYPAIMFNTGDSDTRVDPSHARKMTALLQASTRSDRPILLHYEVQAGHSAGVSVQQAVKDTADELAFLWNETVGRTRF